MQAINSKIKYLSIALLAFISLGAAGCSLLGIGSLDKSTAAINKTSDGVVLRGYDPVAYFTENAPVTGKPEFSTEWSGAKWQFSSAANRDVFVKEPEKYAPQYGGFCAYAVSQGYTADIDPQTGRVVDGKLYVNYSKDVAKTWSQDIPKYISDADKNWRDKANK